MVDFTSQQQKWFTNNGIPVPVDSSNQRHTLITEEQSAELTILISCTWDQNKKQQLIFHISDLFNAYFVAFNTNELLRPGARQHLLDVAKQFELWLVENLTKKEREFLAAYHLVNKLLTKAIIEPLGCLNSLVTERGNNKVRYLNAHHVDALYKASLVLQINRGPLHKAVDVYTSYMDTCNANNDPKANLNHYSTQAEIMEKTLSSQLQLSFEELNKLRLSSIWPAIKSGASGFCVGAIVGGIVGAALGFGIGALISALSLGIGSPSIPVCTIGFGLLGASAGFAIQAAIQGRKKTQESIDKKLSEDPTKQDTYTLKKLFISDMHARVDKKQPLIPPLARTRPT